MSGQRFYGVDFSSAPSLKKPITIAIGELHGDVYVMDQVVGVPHFNAFEAFLAHAGPWTAGFDLPFSLPRALMAHYHWPMSDWPEFIAWYGQQDRSVLRDQFRAFCDGRPSGQKYVYRDTDRPAGSSPAMRWTNPPVAWMAHAGAPRLWRAGVCVPALTPGSDPPGKVRVALEAYPGYTARRVSTRSYKSDTAAKQTEEREQVRVAIIDALLHRRAGLSVRLRITPSWRAAMIADGSGDLMDAAICALQAAHASRLPNYGFPDVVDPLEGWIASVSR